MVDGRCADDMTYAFLVIKIADASVTGWWLRRSTLGSVIIIIIIIIIQHLYSAIMSYADTEALGTIERENGRSNPRSSHLARSNPRSSHYGTIEVSKGAG